MSGFFDIYSIIFLVIAVVIFMRLASVLGRRTGNEPTPFDPRVKQPTGAPRNDNVVTLPHRSTGAAPTGNLEPLARYAEAGTPLHDGLVAVTKSLPDFDVDHFLSGAKMAYEMIVTAFADGDRPTLANLLAPDVYESFEQAVIDREAKGLRAELTFVGIEEAKITAAEVEGGFAKITVNFVSDLISATRDKDGGIVEGDPTDVQTIRDSWTFARETKSRDPNWKLIATEAV